MVGRPLEVGVLEVSHCSPLVRRTRTLEKRIGAGDLTRRWLGGPAILKYEFVEVLAFQNSNFHLS